MEHNAEEPGVIMGAPIDACGPWQPWPPVKPPKEGDQILAADIEFAGDDYVYTSLTWDNWHWVDCERVDQDEFTCFAYINTVPTKVPNNEYPLQPGDSMEDIEAAIAEIERAGGCASSQGILYGRRFNFGNERAEQWTEQDVLDHVKDFSRDQLIGVLLANIDFSTEGVKGAGKRN